MVCAFSFCNDVIATFCLFVLAGSHFKASLLDDTLLRIFRVRPWKQNRTCSHDGLFNRPSIRSVQQILQGAETENRPVRQDSLVVTCFSFALEASNNWVLHEDKRRKGPQFPAGDGLAGKCHWGKS